MRTNPPEFMEHKWQSSWRTDAEGHADCGIFYERHPGHAYALLRAPKYFSKNEWEAVSAHVIKAHESHEALVIALERLRIAYKGACCGALPKAGPVYDEAMAETDAALKLAGAA